jgi:FkbM family methyltransferase
MMRRRWRHFLPFPRRATLRRWFPPFETRNLAHLIARARADLVVDAGANEGQYVAMLRAAGCPGPFLSIEPQEAAHAALAARAARVPGWRVAPRLALGAGAGEATLHRYADASLASLRAPAARHRPAPAFAPAGGERVPVAPLDAVMAGHAPGARRPFLKLDLQGAEREALAGAPETLARAVGVQVELPLAEGYEGEAGYLELLRLLNGFSFVPAYAMKVTARCRLGPWLQMDMVLLRRDLV